MTPIIVMIAAIAGGLVSIGVIYKAIRGLYRFTRTIDDMAEEVKALPEFKAEMRAFKADALHQLYPNSGGSLNDKLTRTEFKVSDTHDMLTAHIGDASIHGPSLSSTVIVNPSDSAGN